VHVKKTGFTVQFTDRKYSLTVHIYLQLITDLNTE